MLTRGDPPPFMKFRDASNITPVFEINLQDCLAGLEKALKYRFFDIGDFYVDEYEYWEVVIIIPSFASQLTHNPSPNCSVSSTGT